MERAYQGLIVGKMHIPYVPIVASKEGWKPEEVSAIFWNSMHELPPEIEAYKKLSISKKVEDAEKAGRKKPNDGQQVRAEAVGQSESGLDLILSKTSYFTKLSSNDSVHARLGNRNETIRESYVDESKLTELTDQLANPIGVQVGIVTSDEKMPLILRSNKIMQYPGLWGIPAGFMDPTKDLAKVEMTNPVYGKLPMRETVSPFFTMIREVGEEILGKAGKNDKKYEKAMQSVLENMRLIGVGRAYDDLHVEVLMTSKIDADSNYLLEASKFAPDKFEYEGKPMMIDFNPDGLIPYLTKTVSERPSGTPDIEGIWIPNSSPEWVPAQWATVYYMLSNQFGEQEVNGRLEHFLSMGNEKSSRRRAIDLVRGKYP